jgi:hypothetical protein
MLMMVKSKRIKPHPNFYIPILYPLVNRTFLFSEKLKGVMESTE